MTLGTFILGFIAGGITVGALMIGLACLGYSMALKQQYEDGHY